MPLCVRFRTMRQPIFTYSGFTKFEVTKALKRIYTSTTADIQYGVTHLNSLLPSVPVNNIDIGISLGWHRILGLSVKDAKSFNQKENRAVLTEIMW